MIQCSRKPAGAVLLATIVAAAVYLHASGARTRAADGPTLAQLELAIANPDASTETWLQYAQRLQQQRRFAHAALAWQRVLEANPYAAAANLQCAICLARAGDADQLHGFLGNLLLVEPRVALDLFGRSELQSFLSQERFQALHRQARAQSMD